MKKQKEILGIINYLQANGQDYSLTNVTKILEERNFKIAPGFLSKIYHDRKNISKKMEFIKKKENTKICKILEIAKNNNEDNKIFLTEIKNLVKNAKISIGIIKLKEILVENGYSMKINYDDFSKRRIEMAELTRLGWTMQMIADKYGITRQAVSLLLKKASSQDNQIVVKGRQSKNQSNEQNCILVKRRKSLDKTKICQGCGKSFLGKGNIKTCSKECCQKIMRTGGKWSRNSFLTLKCKHCGKIFQRSNYIYSITMKKKRNNNHYCGRDCYLDASKKHLVMHAKKEVG